MLCVLILYMSVETYTWKSIPNDRFLRCQLNLLSEFLPEIFWEEVAEDLGFEHRPHV